jgi:SAM-dependent methyltransferase
MSTRTVDLLPTRCAICGTEGDSRELYRANFDLGALNPAVFSARRLPDRVHYRMVKCVHCGLVRSDPVASSHLLARLYDQSAFTYRDEAPDLRHTYRRYLRMLERLGAKKGALLEIGCGNGFFLEEALSEGYRTVRGVEPSRAAIDHADPRVRDRIVCDVMRAGLFGDARFDVVCLFQVFDHVPDPGALLDECLAVLEPGGLVLAINHDVEAVSARLLGEKSPIVDIEHTYLYSPATMSRLFEKHGFEILRSGAARNRYSLHYLFRLFPAPAAFKRAMLAWLQSRAVGQWRLTLPLGNLYLIARKPRESEPELEGIT